MSTPYRRRPDPKRRTNSGGTNLEDVDPRHRTNWCNQTKTSRGDGLKVTLGLNLAHASLPNQDLVAISMSSKKKEYKLLDGTSLDSQNLDKGKRILIVSLANRGCKKTPILAPRANGRRGLNQQRLPNLKFSSFQHVATHRLDI